MKRTASRHKIKEEHTKEINKSLLHKNLSFNDIISKEKDGASRSSSLGSVFGKRYNDRNWKDK